jgi:DNA mismatch repair protein PMS2
VGRMGRSFFHLLESCRVKRLRTRKRNALIVTDGRGSLRSSVISVWGPKALENIQDITLELEVGTDRLMAKREGLDAS